MSIYSTNRSGNMLIGNDSFNERYSGIDAGTIMCDTEANTMAIFEAILYSDFHELEGRKSGVLTEAEAKKFNMESIKGFGDKIVKSLKTCAEKLMALLQSALEKILSYKSEGKQLMKAVESAKKANPNWSGSVEFANYDYNNQIFFTNEIEADFEDALRYKSEGRKSILDRYLTITGESDVTPGNFVKKSLELVKTTVTLNAGNISTFAAEFSEYNKLRKSAKENLNGIKDKFNAAAKSARKACNGKVADIAAINSINSAFQAAASTKVKAYIACIKANTGAQRLAIMKALSAMRKDSKAQHEFAMMEAYTDMSLAFNTDIFVTDEARALAESVVNV